MPSTKSDDAASHVQRRKIRRRKTSLHEDLDEFVVCGFYANAGDFFQEGNLGQRTPLKTCNNTDTFSLKPELHPGKWTWNLKITPLKIEIFYINLLFLGGFHVIFPGCIHVSSFLQGSSFFWKIQFVKKIRVSRKHPKYPSHSRKGVCGTRVLSTGQRVMKLQHKVKCLKIIQQLRIKISWEIE